MIFGLGRRPTDEKLLVSKIVQVGRLSLLAKASEEKPKKYKKGIVLKIEGEEMLEIGLREPWDVSVGEEVKVLFPLAEALYYYSSPVLELKVEPDKTLLLLRYPEKLSRVQRRKYVRVPVVLPVEVTVWRNGELELYPGESRDLSAGGILFVTNADLKVGEEVTVYFPLRLGFKRVSDVPLDDLMEIPGKIVRIARDPDPTSRWKRAYGIEFSNDIPTELRERILRFVFERQRILRKHGQL